ncbi:MAG: tetraacyldisaccharide 4'-kinase [Negativicutes bacterium]|nr:tetraacyldisaccharide 4'-kinase [Negativicutes bacterium]
MNRRNWLDYLYELVHRDENSAYSRFLLAGLYVLSLVYSGLVRGRLLLYRLGVLCQNRLPVRVISIGNITLGGTGKTPTAGQIARLLAESGRRVAILNRGYMAGHRDDIGLVSDGARIYMNAWEAGDEAYLLAKNLPGVAVVIGRERSQTGHYAVDFLGAQVLILDDGYQHWALWRDLDILLVDCLTGFGNQHVLPRGTLREPLANLDRADLFILTKVDQVGEEQVRQIEAEIRKYNRRAPFVHCAHRPCGVVPVIDWLKSAFVEQGDCAVLAGRKVLAVSGIGNPLSFERTLRGLAVEVVRHLQFPDHYAYSGDEISDIVLAARQCRAEAIVITEKDAVKIPPDLMRRQWDMPGYVLKIEIDFVSGAECLHRQIDRLFAGGGGVKD